MASSVGDRFSVLDRAGLRFRFAVAALLGLIALGYAAAHYMEVEGHHVTGMTNQIVWGTPHVFAVFLIVAASGALNVASLASVFGIARYKPLARLSGLLAIALLLGGLVVLVLDLGRPERLIVAMTYYNFKSIFAWNIFLYTGFIVIAVAYLWMHFEPRMGVYVKPVGIGAFVWRIVLTTGTGSIFGFLVAREGYDAAIMAPLFVVMSLVFGTAAFLLFAMAVFRWSGAALDTQVVTKLANLLGIFVAASLYLTAIYHLTNLYITEHHGFERFLLLDGGVHTTLFWLVQVALGGLLVFAVLWTPLGGPPRRKAVVASILALIGGAAQVYVIIIGGQAYPLEMFPGMDASSSFFDGVVAHYSPSLPEVGLGLGGVGLALLIALVGLRVLPFVPDRAAGDVADRQG
ncbi:MAG: polysulfide reductase NrfD [Gammaproteobacteria bacterium]|nr:polysulfide reductase NrfD [Gammaproteobacteria bacterium]